MNTDNPVSPKITAAGLAGAVTVIIVWLLDLLVHVEVPEVVAGAITLIVAVIAGYLKVDPLRQIGLAVRRGEVRRPGL